MNPTHPTHPVLHHQPDAAALLAVAASGATVDYTSSHEIGTRAGCLDGYQIAGGRVYHCVPAYTGRGGPSGTCRIDVTDRLAGWVEVQRQQAARITDWLARHGALLGLLRVSRHRRVPQGAVGVPCPFGPGEPLARAEMNRRLNRLGYRGRYEVRYGFEMVVSVQLNEPKR